jgi:hypothetical protein
VSWFNTYERDGDGLTRVVKTEVDLSELPFVQRTNNELGFRLAVLYPQIDGYEHLTASDEVKTEINSLIGEIRRRGLDPVSNLQWNERCQGWGWLPGFKKIGSNEWTE